MMMCKCRFIDNIKCITLFQDVDNEGSCLCVGIEGVWKLCVFHLTKIALRNSLLKYKKKRGKIGN